MKRDRRLLAPIALLMIAAVALSYQAIIARNFFVSAVLDPNWESLVVLYGVETPPKGPDRFCLDYCAPRMPFVAGWTGIASFFGSFVSLLLIWWKPRS